MGTLLSRRRYMGGKAAVNPYAEYLSQYLTVEMLDAGTISLFIGRGCSDRTIGYSINDGNWVDTNYLYSNNISMTITTPSLVQGDKVRWRCVSVDGAFSKDYGATCRFSTSSNCNVYGNVLSLVYGDNFVGKDSVDSSFQTFRENFQNGFKCVDASNLIFPIKTAHTYIFITAFQNNTIIEKGPVFISDSVNNYALYGTFDGCTSLKSLAILAESCSTSQSNWAKNVPSGGVLTKKTGTTWNLLPTGWTINYISI